MLCFGSSDKLGKYQEDPINKREHDSGSQCHRWIVSTGHCIKGRKPKTHYMGIKLYHVHMSDYFLE